MTPLFRRTWSPKGHRPVLPYRGARQKVSIAAALWLSPGKNRLGLFSRYLVNSYFNNEKVAELVIKALLRRLPGKIIIVWDGGNMHKGDPIKKLIEKYGHRLSLEKLPSYAPMLNPVEPIWSWIKFDRLSNFAPRDARHARRTIIPMLAAAARNQKQMKTFWKASELPLPRALLS